MRITLTVNGDDTEQNIEPTTSLYEVLHDKIGITSVKKGCDSGGCGVCTVLLDNLPVYSCMTPAWKAKGKKITTVEGLGREGKLHPLQEAFVRHSSPQCGFCTPAMLLVAKAALDTIRNPTEDQLKAALCGVLCRCTGYIPYIKAIMEVAVGSQAER